RFFKRWLGIRLTEEPVGIFSPSTSTETRAALMTCFSSIKTPVSSQEVGILRGLWHKNFACVYLTLLRSIAPQRRIGERQLRSDVDPKMKSADAGAQKKRIRS